jgi:N-acyl-L-homoserine lactone synthetase
MYGLPGFKEMIPKERTMIEIIQAGQYGKTQSLIEMHRLRKIIFKDRMGWDVDISRDGLEIDDYDLPETVYFLVRDEENRVVGTWRILPTDSPSMIRNIWPQFLENFAMPKNQDVWECSRFGVHSYNQNGRDHINQVNQVTAKLIWALIKTCLLTHISHIYTLYNPQVGRSVRRIGFIPEATTQEMLVDGKSSIVGRFKMDEDALERIESATGFKGRISEDDLPPILMERLAKTTPKEKMYSYA